VLQGGVASTPGALDAVEDVLLLVCKILKQVQDDGVVFLLSFDSSLAQASACDLRRVARACNAFALVMAADTGFVPKACAV
jgi:hypothetical protein